MKNSTKSFLFFIISTFSLLFIITVIYYQEKSDNLSTHNYEKKLAVGNLQILANEYYNKGAFHESEITVVKAIKLLDSIPKDSFTQESRIGLYNNLGMIYRKMEDYKIALKHYQKVLDSTEKISDSIKAINNMANIYSDIGQYENAVEKLNLVYSKLSASDNSTDKWTVIDNLGFNEGKLNIPEGLDKMLLVLSNSDKNSLSGLFSNYRHLSIHYTDNEEKEIALTYAEKALEIAEKIKSPSYYKEALELKLKLSNEKTIIEYIHLADSLNTVARAQENKYANKKYNYEKTEKEIFKKDLELLKEKNRKYILIAIIVLTIVSIIFLIFYYKQRSKIIRIKERHKTEYALSKKVHDELGNDIFYLMNLIQTDPSYLLGKEGLKVLKGLNDIYIKARDISKQHTKIDTEIAYQDELLSLLNSFGSDHRKIITNEITSDFWSSTSTIKKEQLYRILQELLTNMKKHSEASLVAITFTRHKRHIIIKYVDNGKGSDKTLMKKNGLLNVENRIKEIQGSFTFDTSLNNGFKAEIRFIA